LILREKLHFCVVFLVVLPEKTYLCGDMNVTVKEMEHTADSFFIEHNRVSGAVPEDGYRKASIMLTALDALARTTGKSLYVVDYYKKNFLYVSKNPFFLCGYTPDEVKGMGYSFYLKHVPEEEIDMLVEVNRAGFEFCTGMSPEDRTGYVTSCNFHLVDEGRKMLVNHKLTPLMLNGDGDLWLAVCVVSLSPHREAGHVEMRKTGTSCCWTYSLARHSWEQMDSPSLSDREKDILLLSARGYTMNEIAGRMCISPDTVKFHKRRFFERLNVSNITEALGIASHCGML
jgi:DNA-binding CsgD family transcriptional regulator